MKQAKAPAALKARCSMTRNEWRRTQVLAMNAPSPIMEAADRIKDLEVLRFLLQMPNERLIPEDLVNVFLGVTREVAYLITARMHTSQPRLIDSWLPREELEQGIFPSSPVFMITDAGRHIAMTSVTGSRAREILSEIEAEEMAGQA